MLLIDYSTSIWSELCVQESHSSVQEDPRGSEPSASVWDPSSSEPTVQDSKCKCSGYFIYHVLLVFPQCGLEKLEDGRILTVKFCNLKISVMLLM